MGYCIYRLHDRLTTACVLAHSFESRATRGLGRGATGPHLATDGRYVTRLWHRTSHDETSETRSDASRDPVIPPTRIRRRVADY
jgi:hypothetical protein